ncbi:MAG TPA: MFS transporter [Hyphomicrobiaceae bacterium]|nr:MFS transporter [Hyphomicrobiaceae bacterium]
MKVRSVLLLVVAETVVMSLWFVSAAVLPEMARETDISPTRQALLSSGVQGGFVIGALLFSGIGLPDRFDPRRIFSFCAITAALINGLLLITSPGGDAAIAARVVTGLLLAGVYPVGMKIVVGWGVKDRGLLVGLLVGALSIGSASPHLMAWLGNAEWRWVVIASSVLAGFGGFVVLFSGLGPYHAQSPRFDLSVIATAWSNRRIRLAYAGYLGHMWELFVMWAWVGTMSTLSYAATIPMRDAEDLGKLTAFVAIGMGGVASVCAGMVADQFGKAQVALIAMIVSGGAALITAATFGGAVWFTFLIIVVWGAAIVPDSPQFSALVADAAPPAQAGSLMTFQTALGFTLTFFTVQFAPMFAATFSWPGLIAALAIGPAFGIGAMLRLLQLQRREMIRA